MTIDQAVANIGKRVRYIGSSAAIPSGTRATIIAVTRQRVIIQLQDRQVPVSPHSLNIVRCVPSVL